MKNKLTLEKRTAIDEAKVDRIIVVPKQNRIRLSD